MISWAKKFFNKREPIINPEQPSIDEVWLEIIEIRATQSKILQGMNKWLRAHGRTIQSAEEKPKVENRSKTRGLIKSPWPNTHHLDQ